MEAFQPGTVLEPKNDAHFLAAYDEYTKGDKIIVIQYSGARCPPCKQIFPSLQKLCMLSSQDEETRDLFVFMKVDTAECYATAVEKNIAVVPTFHVDFKGQRMQEMRGANEEMLRKMVETCHLQWREMCDHQAQLASASEK